MGEICLTNRDYCKVGERYARDVVSGKAPACKWVRLACQRQLDDLKRPKGSFRWRFDKKKATDVCEFLETLSHIKGKDWKSKHLYLEPWQCFFITSIFGWVDKDTRHRRYRKAYIEVPRKNGKTFICAGIALFLLCADGEPGAEVYSAAVTRDQARYVWELARDMVKREPEMQDHFGVEPLAHSIIIGSTGSSFKPLSRDADTLEGLSPHGAIIDELHAHKTREVFDVLNVATGSRRQSLIMMITTAGDNKAGICYEQHTYVQQVLQGRHEDDRYFGLIYTLDVEDDWTTEASARKANPNYGVSVLADDLQTIGKQAQASAESQNTFLNKRLNIWTTVGTAYFNMLAWDTVCKDESLTVEDFYGQPCIIGLDLASKKDLSAKIILFKKAGIYYAFGKYYLPEDVISPGGPNYDFYRGWARDNKLTLTPGNRTDYDYIERDLLEDMANLRPIHVGVDPNYNAAQLTTRMLAAGVPMIDVPQNYQTFTEPMKTLDALMISARIKHNGDDVLGWAMGNVVAKKNYRGDVHPDKAQDVNKIDPAVALLNALSLHLKQTESQWDFKVIAI